MKAVVLVGGEGTRLRPLTFTTPKQMLPVAEVTMIERVLGHLAGYGIDEVVLSMGYRPDAFVAAFPDDAAAGVRLNYVVEPEPLDTAGAVAYAARQSGINERFLVVNGDVLTDLDLSALIAFHDRCGGEGTIALTPVDDPSAFGVVPTDGDGRVTAFIEKPKRESAPTNLINAGFYVLEASAIDRIPAGRRVNIERETFPAMVEAGSLYATSSDAYWTDTGTPHLYLKANLDLLSGERGIPSPGAVEIFSGVWTIGSPVLDGDPVGRALVGDAAYIAAGAKVENAVIGTGARVGAGARVTDAVLLAGAVVRDGATVENSIVGEASVIESGAVLNGLSVIGRRETIQGGACLSGARIPPVD